MAEDKKQESGGLTGALPVGVLLAILAGLVSTHLAPYHEERPSNRSLQDHYVAAQDVDARLWQDPFAAAGDTSEETPGPQGAEETAGSSSHARDRIYPKLVEYLHLQPVPNVSTFPLPLIDSRNPPDAVTYLVRLWIYGQNE